MENKIKPKKIKQIENKKNFHSNNINNNNKNSNKKNNTNIKIKKAVIDLVNNNNNDLIQETKKINKNLINSYNNKKNNCITLPDKNNINNNNNINTNFIEKNNTMLNSNNKKFKFINRYYSNLNRSKTITNLGKISNSDFNNNNNHHHQFNYSSNKNYFKSLYNFNLNKKFKSSSKKKIKSLSKNDSNKNNKIINRNIKILKSSKNTKKNNIIEEINILNLNNNSNSNNNIFNSNNNNNTMYEKKYNFYNINNNRNKSSLIKNIFNSNDNSIENNIDNNHIKNFLKNKLYNKINNINNNDNNNNKNYKNNNINFIEKIKKRPKSNFSLRSNRSLLNKSLNNNFNSNNNINNNNFTLFLNIYSNWGNSTKICINNIKFFNKENKEIFYANSNISNFPFVSKFHKSEIKKIFFNFNQEILSIRFIEILNGFNDLGIKNIQILNDKNKNIWKGVIRKINQLTNKTHKIEIFKNSIYKKISPKYSSQIILHSNNNNINNNKNNNSNSNFNRTLSNNNSKINNIFINNTNNKNNSNKIKYYSPFRENKKISKISIEKNSINSQETIINYELCNKIKFNLHSNYGNSFYIGLTGIEIFDNNNNNINNKIKYCNFHFQNTKNILFKTNNNNFTNNPNKMFLTKINNKYSNIEIEFKSKEKIKFIKFFNYNFYSNLDCCVKECEIIFYNNKKVLNNIKIYLFKPPGENNIDFSQNFHFPFVNNNNNKKNNIFTIKKNIFNYYYYYSPHFPIGFIIKIEIYSNYGDFNYIAIDDIKIFDENNENIINKTEKIFFLPFNNNNNDCFLYTEFSNSKLINNNGINRIYFFYENYIQLNKIEIKNYSKNYSMNIKDIKIFIDDNIIYEGEIKGNGQNNIINFNYNEALNESYVNQDERPRYEMIQINQIKMLRIIDYDEIDCQNDFKSKIIETLENNNDFINDEKHSNSDFNDDNNDNNNNNINV